MWRSRSAPGQLKYTLLPEEANQIIRRFSALRGWEPVSYTHLDVYKRQVLDHAELTDPVMQEEIFGPELPVLTYKTVDEAIAIQKKVLNGAKPLALYLFARDKTCIRKVLEQISFGGGCINDTIVHLATSHMGFGGVGDSGMGSYHGKLSFDTFTHEKSILKKSNFLDLPVRYQPAQVWKMKALRIFMK